MTAIQKSAIEWEHRFLSRIDEMARQWVILGKEVLECQQRRYYLELGYGSFNAWLSAHKDRIGVAKSTITDSKRLYTAMVESNVSAEDMALIPRCNAATMTYLSEKSRSKAETLKLAQSLHGKEFKAAMQAKYPDCFVNDPKTFWGFNTVASRAEEINGCIDFIMEKFHIENRPQIVAYALLHFKECPEATGEFDD